MGKDFKNGLPEKSKSSSSKVGSSVQIKNAIANETELKLEVGNTKKFVKSIFSDLQEKSETVINEAKLEVERAQSLYELTIIDERNSNLKKLIRSIVSQFKNNDIVRKDFRAKYFAAKNYTNNFALRFVVVNPDAEKKVADKYDKFVYINFDGVLCECKFDTVLNAGVTKYGVMDTENKVTSFCSALDLHTDAVAAKERKAAAEKAAAAAQNAFAANLAKLVATGVDITDQNAVNAALAEMFAVK